MRLVAIMDALVIMVVVHMIATITLNTKEKPSKSKKQAPETIEKTIEILRFSGNISTGRGRIVGGFAKTAEWATMGH